MKSTLLRYLALGAAIGFVLAAIILGQMELVEYRNLQLHYPNGFTIAGIPVDGLTRQEAATRLASAFESPVVLRYDNTSIHAQPEDLGFSMDLQSMLDTADRRRIQAPFLEGFWDYLWNRSVTVKTDIPIQATVNRESIHRYFDQQIIPRYDQPSIATHPVVGNLHFTEGKPGRSFNQELAAEQIEQALRSPERRTVVLNLTRIDTPPPSQDHLKLMIQQMIDRAGFTGLVEVYMHPMPEGEPLHFAYLNRQYVTPDIAFTAASTVKIPIMVSVYRREDEPMRQDVRDMLGLMISESKNEPADRLMEVVLDPIRGPLIVTEDLQALGFQNSFLAGYFYMGAHLLQIFETPANQRPDINLQPDIYNQTTPREMGMLLGAIYKCAEENSGLLIDTFPGQITQAECKQMIELLVSDKLPYLLTAGLPEGTKIAHKHGWIEEADGLLHTMSDAAIIFSPGGDYVLLVYMHNNEQLLFEQGNALMADISKVVYSFFNPSPQ